MRKWLHDLIRNRRDNQAGEPFFLGPRTIDTPEEVDALLRGLAVPVEHPQVAAIRRLLQTSPVPRTADEIARMLCNRHKSWNPGSVKRRVSDARLVVVDREGVSAKNCACARYALEAS